MQAIELHVVNRIYSKFHWHWEQLYDDRAFFEIYYFNKLLVYIYDTMIKNM